MSNQRPRGRDRSTGSSGSNSSSGSSNNGTGGVYRRGSGLGTGPVGRKEGYGGRFGNNSGSSNQGSQNQSGYQHGQNQQRVYRGSTNTGGTGINLNGVQKSGGGCLTKIIPILIVIIVGYFIIKFLFGGSGSSTGRTSNRATGAS